MNQKIKAFLVIFAVCFFGLSQLYSQEQTAYHKKIFELKKSLIKECLIVSDNWSENIETEFNNFSEKEIDEILQMIKLGFAGLQKETAVKIINKFISDVENAKKLKSTDEVRREFDDAREKRINQYVNELKEVKKLLIEMELEGY